MGSCGHLGSGPTGAMRLPKRRLDWRNEHENTQNAQG